jgi:hypothetical protein
MLGMLYQPAQPADARRRSAPRAANPSARENTPVPRTKWPNNRSHNFALLLRYKAQAERDYRRALEEFERLRKLPPLAEFPNEPIASRETASDPQLLVPALE